MVKKPSESILTLRYFKKIMLILGICSFLLMQGSFQVLAASGLNVFNSDNLQQKMLLVVLLMQKMFPRLG